MTPAFFLGTFPVPGRVADLARMTEADGWDGLALTDSQNLAGDVFAGLAIAAQSTSRLLLATGATNPATRHPAVLASAMATLQVESGGRAWLGIARGDSALAYLGRKPMPLGEFETALSEVHAYLGGETVDQNGFASRIEWLSRTGMPAVPISVAATGPRVIEIAAHVADAITFSVGADPARLEPAIALARKTRVAHGLAPLRLGAYVNAVAHPDIATARQMVRGRMGVYARFSTMSRSVMDALPDADRKVAEDLVSSYDLQAHAASGARHEAALDDDFVDRFGVVGPSEHVAERLIELVQLGLDHVVIVGHSRNTPREVFAESSRRFGQEVLPMVRRAVS
ncbi:MAG: LLM class flavin-dependent oxidoreductase [Chloroflexi bacterium]|nr:LLM class flavin-dependent oxidoreductase [Chloroflexota bacterium]